MSLPVFYLASVSELSPGQTCLLDGDEGHHASVVRRIRVGEPLLLTDGAGVIADVEAASVERGRVGCRLLKVRSIERPALHVTVVQAIPKGERGERAVDLLTEVGVDQIIPWQAERCVSRWKGDKVERGRAKWSATARQAAKQSRRAWWPVVAAVAETADVADHARDADVCLVLHEAASEPLAERIALGVLPSAGRVVIVVGPEGGLSAAELTQLGQAGGLPVKLGPTVLRTSTAGVVAATLVLATASTWGRRLGALPEGSTRDD